MFICGMVLRCTWLYFGKHSGNCETLRLIFYFSLEMAYVSYVVRDTSD